MSLQSRLFRDDPALESCLVHDASHVQQGALGNHVSKIQTALSVLDDAKIDPGEISAMRYGPSTASAVLSYKTKRQIINPSYQTQADSIVGKMTIAALDSEMLSRDKRRTPCLACGDPIRPTGRRGSSLFSGRPVGRFGGMSPPDQAQRVFPAKLVIVWHPTRAGARAGNRNLSYFTKARDLLAPFQISIVGCTPGVLAPFPNDDRVDPTVKDDIWKVRKDSEKTLPGYQGALRVILCPFVDGPEFGLTDGGTYDKATFRDFTLINTNRVRADQCTFIHEMIHATGVGLFVHDSDGASVFSTGDNRSVLRDEHAERLSNERTTYFARRK